MLCVAADMDAQEMLTTLNDDPDLPRKVKTGDKSWL